MSMRCWTYGQIYSNLKEIQSGDTIKCYEEECIVLSVSNNRIITSKYIFSISNFGKFFTLLNIGRTK